LSSIVVTKRNLVERWRVILKEAGDSSMSQLPQFVMTPCVPHVKEEKPTSLENSIGFTRRESLVGHKHDSELAHNCNELAVSERQITRVSFQPLYPFALAKLGSGLPKHRLV